MPAILVQSLQRVQRATAVSRSGQHFPPFSLRVAVDGLTFFRLMRVPEACCGVRERPLFVYGSLLVPHVRERFIECAVTSLEAILEGYERRAFGDGTYPAIRPQPGSRVEGQVLLGLSTFELGRIDEYEGTEYERRAVEVILRETGKPCKAQTYVVAAAYQASLLAVDWSLEAYLRSLRSDDCRDL